MMESFAGESARIPVHSDAHDYPVVVGDGVLSALPGVLASVVPDRRIAFISDRTVADLHTRTAVASCEKAGIKASRNSRGLGPDHHTPIEWKAMPAAAVPELTDTLRVCERDIVAPIQSLVMMIALVLKPAGGDRPIALSSLLQVLWSGIRSPPVRSWENGFVKFWDDAVRGSSALQAALLRCLNAEIAQLSGHASLSIFWDMAKFYDSIDLVRLMILGNTAGILARTFMLDMMSHCSPRFLRWCKSCSDIIEVSNGMLAGGKFSNTYARIALYPILHACRYRVPGSIRQLVDDLSQTRDG